MPAPLSDTKPIGLDTSKLRERRDSLHLSQKDAAKAARMTVAQWNDIESGRRSNITLDTLDRIARALGVSPADLLK